MLQSNVYYPDNDYPDFLIIQTFSLVPSLKTGTCIQTNKEDVDHVVFQTIYKSVVS